MDEIKTYADKVTILRDGTLAGYYDVKDVSVIRLSELMVGRKVELLRKMQKNKEEQRTIIRLNDFSVNMPGEELHNVDFEIRKGEILGIGGLAGHGKAAIANGIMGLYPSAGDVYLDEQPLDVSDTCHTSRQKIAFVSEDRRGVGLLLEESIELNITVAAMRVRNDFTRKAAGIRFYNKKEGSNYAREMIEQLDIRCTGTGQYVGRLSGGNQQKVCIARAITMKLEILFVSEPTRGIDIGAKKDSGFFG